MHRARWRRSSGRLLRQIGEPFEPPVLAPARDPPFFASRVLRRRLGELDAAPSAQVEMFGSTRASEQTSSGRRDCASALASGHGGAERAPRRAADRGSRPRRVRTSGRGRSRPSLLVRSSRSSVARRPTANYALGWGLANKCAFGSSLTSPGAAIPRPRAACSRISSRRAFARMVVAAHPDRTLTESRECGMRVFRSSRF